MLYFRTDCLIIKYIYIFHIVKFTKWFVKTKPMLRTNILFVFKKIMAKIQTQKNGEFSFEYNV